MLIAVTGARGRVGRSTVKDLLAHGHRVRALLRTPWPECPEACEKIEGLDLRDFDRVKESLSGCDAVVHIANIPGPLDEDRPETFINNVTVNFNILLAAGLLGIRRVAVAGSNCAGGFCRNHHYPDPPYFPLDEACPPTPDDTYGMSKAVSEMVARQMCQRFPFMTVVTLRISWVVGEEVYGPKAVQRDREHPKEGYYGNLGTYIDERDAAAAFRLAVEKDLPAGAHVYYVMNPDSRCPAPVQEFLAERFPGVPLKKPLGPHDALESSEKAMRELGWQPKHFWREELAKFQ